METEIIIPDAPDMPSIRPSRGNESGTAVQRRVLDFSNLQIRAKGDGSPPVITGYAAVFNQPSEVIADFFGAFRETIQPGAFAKTLKDGADVRALINHDPNFVLGRTKSDTLALKEDGHGLWMEITPPDTQWARDLLATMRRGDIDQSSFGFQAVKDRWGELLGADGQMMEMHYLLEARLFDVSVVTYPAYPQTEAAVRSLLSAAGFNLDALTHAIGRAQRGLSLSEHDLSELRGAVDRLRSYMPIAAAAEPVPPGHSAESECLEPVPPGHSLGIDWSRLERLEKMVN